MCVCTCVSVEVCAPGCSAQRPFPLELDFQAVVSSLVWELGSKHRSSARAYTLNPRDVSAAQTSPILFAPKPMGPAIWAGVCWVVLLHVTVPGLFMWLQPPAASTQRCLYVSPHLRSSLIGHGVALLQAP